MATYKITGLDCGNCAARLEKAIGKVKGVKKATINFVTGKVFIDVNGDETQVLADVEALVKKNEPKATFVKV